MKRCLWLFAIGFSSLFGLEEEDLVWKDAPSVQEYQSAMQQALSAKDWWGAIDYAEILSYNFPTTPFAQEAPFVMGEAYYKLDHLEQANECLSGYLKQTISPKHFEEAIAYKFHIAERFAEGEKKRLFSSVKMPAWVPAKEDSIEIFDEVIAAMPHSDMAVHSMLSKAKVQAYFEDFKPSIETLDTLIRRFPKHDLTAEAYLEKEKVFFQQCQIESLNLDILDLAELNVRKFRLAFPRESRLAEAEKIFTDMEELFAQNLFETGNFFERTNKIPASLIYYNKVVAKYPRTDAATAARQKLELLQPAS